MAFQQAHSPNTVEDDALSKVKAHVKRVLTENKPAIHLWTDKNIHSEERLLHLG